MNEDLPQIAVIDLETEPFKHGRIPKAFAAGFFDGKTYSQIWDDDEKKVLRWCCGKVKKFDGLVYAHNGGKFDFIGYLFKVAGETIWGELVREIAGRLVKMQFGRAEIRDSYAILPAPLKSYDKGEIDYSLFEQNVRDHHKQSICEYLRRDCESLHSLVTAFLCDHGISPLTAASAGMKFLKAQGYEVNSLTETQDEKFRAFYFGGLVLARKPGIHCGSFEIFDIKSAYPFAMLHQHAFGTEFDFLCGGERIENSDFVVVEGDARECFLRREKEKNTWGGEGQFRVTGWEYNRALELGLFTGRVIYVERPQQTSDFKRYVEHFYAQKEEAEKVGDKARRQIAKIMLNAVYGKFAQRPDRYFDKAIMPCDEAIPAKSEWVEDAVFDEFGFSIWKRPSKFGTFYNVSTAASITGFVRSMLMKAIHETDPFYCDTDSVICDGRREPSGVAERLGGWGREVSGDLLFIAGKKLYALRIRLAECADEQSARKKGYYWQSDDFCFLGPDGKDQTAEGGRAWKMATKGCRMGPWEMSWICRGKGFSYCYRNDAPTFTIGTGSLQKEGKLKGRRKHETIFQTRNIKMTV